MKTMFWSSSYFPGKWVANWCQYYEDNWDAHLEPNFKWYPWILNAVSRTWSLPSYMSCVSHTFCKIFEMSEITFIYKIQRIWPFLNFENETLPALVGSTFWSPRSSKVKFEFWGWFDVSNQWKTKSLEISKKKHETNSWILAELDLR